MFVELKEKNTNWEKEVNWNYLRGWKHSRCCSVSSYLPEELRFDNIDRQMTENKITLKLEKIEYDTYDIETLGTTFKVEDLSVHVEAYLDGGLILKQYVTNQPRYFKDVIGFIQYANKVLESEVSKFFRNEYEAQLEEEKTLQINKLMDRVITK